MYECVVPMLTVALKTTVCCSDFLQKQLQDPEQSQASEKVRSDNAVIYYI